MNNDLTYDFPIVFQPKDVDLRCNEGQCDCACASTFTTQSGNALLIEGAGYLTNSSLNSMRISNEFHVSL